MKCRIFNDLSILAKAVNVRNKCHKNEANKSPKSILLKLTV